MLNFGFMSCEKFTELSFSSRNSYWLMDWSATSKLLKSSNEYRCFLEYIPGQRGSFDAILAIFMQLSLDVLTTRAQHGYTHDV